MRWPITWTEMLIAMPIYVELLASHPLAPQESLSLQDLSWVFLGPREPRVEIEGRKTFLTRMLVRLM